MFFYDPGSPGVIQLENLPLPINKDHVLYSFLVKTFKAGRFILSNQLASIMSKSSLKAAVTIYRSLTTGNPKIPTIFALLSICVKLEAIREDRNNQSLATFKQYYANIQFMRDL